VVNKLEPTTHYGVVDKLPPDNNLKYLLNEILGEFHDLNEVLVANDLGHYGYNAIDRVERLIENYGNKR
jgi:hypothetical protein